MAFINGASYIYMDTVYFLEFANWFLLQYKTSHSYLKGKAYHTSVLLNTLETALDLARFSNNMNKKLIHCQWGQNRCSLIYTIPHQISPIENQNDLELDFKGFFFVDSCGWAIVLYESNWCHSGITECFEIFKMASKMAVRYAPKTYMTNILDQKQFIFFTFHGCFRG